MYGDYTWFGKLKLAQENMPNIQNGATCNAGYGQDVDDFLHYDILVGYETQSWICKYGIMRVYVYNNRAQ